MQPKILETLTLAIRERFPVELEYRYPGQGVRVVHPHALYRTGQGMRCDAYQVAGYTSKGRALPGWRAFDVEQVVSVELLQGNFALAPDYNPAARKYKDGVIASPDPLGDPPQSSP